MHVDFGRTHQVFYAVSPSVCLDFKPSFDIRFLVLGPGGAPTDRWAISVMLTDPYKGGELCEAAVRRFFDRARKHARQRPGLVDINIEADVRSSRQGRRLLTLLQSMVDGGDGDWEQVLGELRSAPEKPTPDVAMTPPCLPLLEQALSLPDASLVIFRDRLLIEFKTEKLGGVFRYEEDGHVSWQIGRLEDHHCHLSLSAVERVLFTAESVPCQGGGLNYTAWFLTSGPSGNPWRRDGYFSITLNRPYRGVRPRVEVIEPMLDLYRRFSTQSWVRADEAFLQVVNEGPPARPRPGVATHA
jgi:hypothetical protein